MLSWGSGAGCTSRDVFSSLILSSFFLFVGFFFFFFLISPGPPLSPLEICLGDFVLAGSPGCQPPGAVPSILPAGLEAGRFLARAAFCQCPSPACLEVVGALWFPGLETGTPELTEALPPPRCWLCLLAAALLFSAVAAFEIQTCF